MKRVLFIALLVTTQLQASKSGKIKDLCERLGQNQAKVTEYAGTIAQLNQKIQESTDTIKDLKSKLERTNFDHATALQIQIDLVAAKEAELERLRLELNNKLAEMNTQVKEAKAEVKVAKEDAEDKATSKLSNLVNRLGVIVDKFEKFDFMTKLEAVANRLEKFEENLDAMLK